LSIRQLRTLLAIADHGTFGAAAEVMHLTQSAVSMQVRALEDELRGEIFDRSKRPPILNAYGRRLVERAREIVSLYDQMVGAVSNAGDLSGTLSLGAVPTTFTGLVPKALAAVRLSHPNLQINVVTELSVPLVDLLHRGDIDAAVLTLPPMELNGLTWRTIATEPLVVIAPPEARDLDAHEILTTYPYIRFNRRAWVGRTIEAALKENGIEVRVSMELDTLEAVSIMVYHGLGASIVPSPCVDRPAPLPLCTVSFGGAAHTRTLVFAERLVNPRAHLTSVLYGELLRLGMNGGGDQLEPEGDDTMP
jgi:DNA-binding transcriptional LysR family regulator